MITKHLFAAQLMLLSQPIRSSLFVFLLSVSTKVLQKRFLISTRPIKLCSETGSIFGNKTDTNNETLVIVDRVYIKHTADRIPSNDFLLRAARFNFSSQDRLSCKCSIWFLFLYLVLFLQIHSPVTRGAQSAVCRQFHPTVFMASCKLYQTDDRTSLVSSAFITFVFIYFMIL